MDARYWLFDVDGTLVDSNAGHAEAWRQAFCERGYIVHYGTVRRMIGMGGDHLIPAIAGVSSDSAEGKALSKRRGEIFSSAFMPTLQAFSATRRLFQFLRSRGSKIAIASSAQEAELTQLLRIASVDDLVDAVVSGSEVDHSKPNVDIVAAALEKLGCDDPSDAVMVGDTPYDLSAAKRAGVKSIALRTGGWIDASLEDAAEIHEDPAALLNALYRQAKLSTRALANPIFSGERHALQPLLNQA